MYTPYFCEENIYKLCQQLTGQQDYDGELFAVFISNREKLVSSVSRRCILRHECTPIERTELSRGRGGYFTPIGLSGRVGLKTINVI